MAGERTECRGGSAFVWRFIPISQSRALAIHPQLIETRPYNKTIN